MGRMSRIVQNLFIAILVILVVVVGLTVVYWLTRTLAWLLEGMAA